MPLIYVTERKIRSDFKPDFPVKFNAAHPFAKNVTALFAPRDAHNLQNLVLPSDTLTVVGSPANSITAKGRGVTPVTVNSDYWYEPSITYASTAAQTLFWIGYPQSGTVVMGNLSPTLINWDGWYLTYSSANTNFTTAAASNNTFSTGATSAVGSAPVGALAIVMAVYESPTSRKIYVNGVLGGTDTSSITPINTDQKLAIGVARRSSTPDNGFIGTMLTCGVLNRSLTAAEVAILSANCYQLLRPKQRDLYLATSSAAVNNLTGTSTESQTVTGSPTIGINMVAASVQQQSGNGAVTVSAQLSGTATATQQANGNLLVSIPLNGATIAQAIATASLAVGNALSGNTQQIQSGTGSLNISITLSGTEIQQAYASGTLTNTAAGAVALVGASDQVQSASGILSIGDNLAGASLAISSATGNLTTLVPLAGATVQAQLASGGLTVTAAGVNLSGQEVQSQLASGTLTLRVNLNAQSVQQALNTGYLTSSGTLVPHPTKWHIKATKRNWTIQATKRTWLIA